MEQHELFKSIYSSNLKSRAINVMSCLITYMNKKDNTCFPSIKTIAKCCSMGVSTVKRALTDLVEAGFVTKEARFIENKNMAQTSNLYHLSEAFTEPEAKKAKEVISAVCTEAKDRDYADVSFEDFKTKGENSAETKQLQQNYSTTYKELPKSQAVLHEKQAFIVPALVSTYRWTALQPILVPP